MGDIVRRKYIEVPIDYWVSSLEIEYIFKEEDKCLDN